MANSYNNGMTVHKGTTYFYTPAKDSHQSLHKLLGDVVDRSDSDGIMLFVNSTTNYPRFSRVALSICSDSMRSHTDSIVLKFSQFFELLDEGSLERVGTGLWSRLQGETDLANNSSSSVASVASREAANRDGITVEALSDTSPSDLYESLDSEPELDDEPIPMIDVAMEALVMDEPPRVEDDRPTEVSIAPPGDPNLQGFTLDQIPKDLRSYNHPPVGGPELVFSEGRPKRQPKPVEFFKPA